MLEWSMLHVAVFPLISWPYWSYALAVSCRDCPTWRETGEGVTCTVLTTGAAMTVRVTERLTPPTDA